MDYRTYPVTNFLRSRTSGLLLIGPYALPDISLLMEDLDLKVKKNEFWDTPMSKEERCEEAIKRLKSWSGPIHWYKGYIGLKIGKLQYQSKKITPYFLKRQTEKVILGRLNFYYEKFTFQKEDGFIGENGYLGMTKQDALEWFPEVINSMPLLPRVRYYLDSQACMSYALEMWILKNKIITT